MITINHILLADGEADNKKELAIHHFMQGEFLLNQGNYALAVLEFQDALNIDPNASTIHISIADAYRRLGRSKHAEDHRRQQRPAYGERWSCTSGCIGPDRPDRRVS